MTKRIFTDAELEEMGRLTVDELQEAIEQGDKERAKKLARRMYREFQAMHDLYVDWISGTLSWVGRRFGDEVLDEALTQGMESWLRALGSVYPKNDLRRSVELLARGLKGHLQPLKIEEDSEKITVTQIPCGSGGRLISRGTYGPPQNFLLVQKPQPMTWDRKDFPVYCAHCWFANFLPICWGETPPFFTLPSEKLGEEPCRYVFYKDPKFIPEEISSVL